MHAVCTTIIFEPRMAARCGRSFLFQQAKHVRFHRIGEWFASHS